MTFISSFCDLRALIWRCQELKNEFQEAGTSVPEQVIRRRFDRSMQNFLVHYRHLAEVWTLFDNSGEIPKVIAFERDETTRIIDRSTYTALVKRYGRT
jgi:predicted ABC-type ATPase